MKNEEIGPRLSERSFLFHVTVRGPICSQSSFHLPLSNFYCPSHTERQIQVGEVTKAFLQCYTILPLSSYFHKKNHKNAVLIENSESINYFIVYFVKWVPESPQTSPSPNLSHQRFPNFHIRWFQPLFPRGEVKWHSYMSSEGAQ